jgi:hypothetical protein
LGIVHGRENRVEEAARRIGREIDRDACGGSDRTGNLDIEHYFRVGPVGVARWIITGAIDADRDHLWRSKTKFGEVLREIPHAEPTAELDDGNFLTRSAKILGKAIYGGDFSRKESRTFFLARSTPEMWRRLWPIVEAENALDDSH